jgi:hypothetical protein
MRAHSTEVPRRVLDLGGQLEDVGGDVAVGALLVRGDRDRAPRVDVLRPRVLLAGRVAERLGHVPDR